MTNSFYNHTDGAPATQARGISQYFRNQLDAIAAGFDGVAASSSVQSQWVVYAPTATFISATSFSVAGNQTAIFQVDRRVKTVNTAGTVYGRISASVFGAVTTVTVVNDSGALDIGLSAVSYGLLTPTNPAVPATYTKVADLAASSGSSLSGHIAAGTGAVATTVQEKNRRYYDAFETFSAAQRVNVAARTGSLNIVTAVNAALLAAFTSGQKAIRFPAGRYYCGQYSASTTMFDLATYGDKFTLIADGEVEFVCETTTNDTVPIFFRATSNNKLTFKGTFSFIDLGGDPAAVGGHRGAAGIILRGAASTWRDIEFDTIKGENLTYPVACYEGTGRVQDINIDRIVSKNCYYGFNCQSQGDRVNIGLIEAELAFRPYFVYGVHTHKVRISNRNNRGTSGAVNIGRLVPGQITRDLDIEYSVRECPTGTTHVLINHIDCDATGGTIQNIKLKLDLDGDSVSTPYNPVRFVNYTGSGGSETTAASFNIVKDISIEGVASSGANPITVFASYLEAGQISIKASRFFDFDATVPEAFRFATSGSAADIRTYTPTWTGTITNPAIVDGTLTGEYSVDSAGICHYTFYLAIGASTTFGSGTWIFGLPFKARRLYNPELHVGQIRDAGTQFICATALLALNAATFTVIAQGGTANISPTAPMTWAVGDALIVSGSFAI